MEQLAKEHLRSRVEERSRINRTTSNKAPSDNLSQSDSEHEGNMFSSKKKLSRKRGHDGAV